MSVVSQDHNHVTMSSEELSCFHLCFCETNYSLYLRTYFGKLENNMLPANRHFTDC